MKTFNRGPAEMAKWLRKHSLHSSVSPTLRKEAVRVAKNLDAIARCKAKKAQNAE